MGLFKGMRDLQDLSKDDSGMPSIRAAFSDIGKLADDRTGHAHPRTRPALAELATANGDAVGLAVGV
jgi:hypothetical protein